MNTVTIGSRGSKLALLQTNQVHDMLIEVYPHLNININIIKTKGDNDLDKPLHEIGGKSIFTGELEDELLSHNVDIAVHSLKDLPSTLPEGLIYDGSPGRADARDVFVSEKWNTLDKVPQGGTIATGSSRRKAQMLQYRPDLHIVGLRGNIDTRLRKLDKNKWDGIIMASSALHRLGLHSRISQYLDPEYFVPAGGQGAIGLELAVDREDVKPLLNAIIDEETTSCCKAERLYLQKMESSCFSPIGCLAKIDKDDFIITGYVACLNGSRYIKKTEKGKVVDSKKLALQLADNMIQDGAKEIMGK